MAQVVKFSVRDLGKHGYEVTFRAKVLEGKGELRDTICGHYPDKQDAIRAACVEYMKRNLFSDVVHFEPDSERTKIEILYKYIDGKTFTRTQTLEGKDIYASSIAGLLMRDSDGFLKFDDRVNTETEILEAYEEYKIVYEIVRIRELKPDLKPAKIYFYHDNGGTYESIVDENTGKSLNEIFRHIKVSPSGFRAYKHFGIALHQELIDFHNTSTIYNLKSLGYFASTAEQLMPLVLEYKYVGTRTYARLHEVSSARNQVLINWLPQAARDSEGFAWISNITLKPEELVQHCNDVRRLFSFGFVAVEAKEVKNTKRSAKVFYKYEDGATKIRVVDATSGEQLYPALGFTCFPCGKATEQRILEFYSSEQHQKSLDLPRFTVVAVEPAEKNAPEPIRVVVEYKYELRFDGPLTLVRLVKESDGTCANSLFFVPAMKPGAFIASCQGRATETDLLDRYNRSLPSKGLIAVSAREIHEDRRLWSKEDRIADLEKINKDLAGKLAESNDVAKDLTQKNAELANKLIAYEREKCIATLGNLPVRFCVLNSKTNRVIVQLRRADNNEWIFSTEHLESEGDARSAAAAYATKHNMLIVGETSDRSTYGDKTMIEEHRKTKEELNTTRKELESLRRSVRSLGGIA